MTMLADLHTHSTASDGQYSPTELIRRAAACGTEVLALTDHDTLDGLAEAERAGAAAGIRVIRGVELSAAENPGLHILGYGISTAPSRLSRLCDEMREGRDQRKFRIVDYLRDCGVEISLREVEEVAGGSIIGRPHFAQVMLRHGYVSSIQEAFARYLDTDAYQKVERAKPDVRTCIEVIREAGGHVSLAHPYQLKLDEDTLDRFVGELAGLGLEAVECLYPRHTPGQTAFYLALAEKYRLRVTGGSDFHGERVKPDITPAALPLDVDWLSGG